MKVYFISAKCLEGEWWEDYKRCSNLYCSKSEATILLNGFEKDAQVNDTSMVFKLEEAELETGLASLKNKLLFRFLKWLHQ